MYENYEIINTMRNAVRVFDMYEGVIAEWEGVRGNTYITYEDTEMVSEFAKITQASCFSVHNLPDPEPNVMYIVTSLIAHEYMDERDDLLFPDGLVRKDGKTVGCRRLIKL